MAAAFEAEVLPGDLDPLEVLGGSEHFFDQFAALGLNLLSLHQGLPCLGDPVGEAVANRLQLAEVQHPRHRGDGIDPVRDRGVAEGLAEEPSQLSLETADLAAQL